VIEFGQCHGDERPDWQYAKAGSLYNSSHCLHRDERNALFGWTFPVKCATHPVMLNACARRFGRSGPGVLFRVNKLVAGRDIAK
jgi:hypothetical protein